MTTERQFIRNLQAQFPARAPVLVGIGDDGAVLDVSADSRNVIVTDLLLDRVHFDLRTINPLLVGRKAMAVNLSDLAAMGCRPTAAFVSIAIPRDLSIPVADFLDELYRGIRLMTDEFQCSLAGGDTNSWHGPFAINVCLTGAPFVAEPFLRSNAKPGDAIFVSGPLGGSLHSERHLTFTPRLRLAEWLSNNVEVHGVMDVSDGLSLDLHRMLEASNMAAEIKDTSIPVHPDVPFDWDTGRRLRAAFSDGEDFELLFTVESDVAETLRANAKQAGFDLHQIGRVVQGSGVQRILATGEIRPLAVTGWQHEF